MLNYGIILRITCVVLALRYFLATDAAPRGKSIVGGLALASFWFPWPVVTILVQLAVCLFVLFYLKAFPSNGRDTTK
jgi:hypothetical protein